MLRRSVDGAAPNSGGQVDVFVRLASENCCADQCLEGAVDERRVESVVIDVVVDRLGDGDVRCRPAVSGGDTGDGLECVAVVETHGGGAEVELVMVNGNDGLCVSGCVGP